MRNATKERVVVIGNGMVGYKLCEYLVDGGGSGRFKISCFGDEPRPAYDRVQLTSYLGGRTADDLLMADAAWYRRSGIELFTGDPIRAIDRDAKTVHAASGRAVPYDHLVLATGSAAFVPPVPGIDARGIFVYRTIEDLDAIRSYAGSATRAAVIGGGLLGLEAAKALYDLGLETHVVEFAPGLMARQLDSDGADLLGGLIGKLGVRVHTSKQTERIVSEGSERIFEFADGERLAVDLIVISAGIRPRDELASRCDLELGERGGIAVDDTLRTSDKSISAIGECASHHGMVYGLVAPGYQMADVVAARLTGVDKRFTGADMSTKLKLMGVDVASIGDSTTTDRADTTYVTVRDELAGVYKKLIVQQSTGILRGAVLVGDTTPYARLLATYRSAEAMPNPPISLIVEGGDLAAAGDVSELGDEALICTCNDVTKGAVCTAVCGGATGMGDLKKATQAGTGCGGCVPQLQQLLDAELRKAGLDVRKVICEHFDLTRAELFALVKVGKHQTFGAVLQNHGRGSVGCEVCKPAVASMLASIHGLTPDADPTIQDTNDRFLANIQRGGTYSVIPRIPGGEITPDGLITLGMVAKKYGLYLKITGGQRIDMLGARVDDLPAIWAELVGAGFESGHAYAKGLRTVKSCVGSTWCRFGVLDSVGFSIRVENRYKGLRSPHKLKSAVSGCIRECAEARSKDFGIIATSEGWNLYVCGNGGANPRHAELLASGLDDETCLRYIDRFLMYYIHTAAPLTRTARWLEDLEGGFEHLRSVVVEDSLGIGAQLEADMEALLGTYECEWAKVVASPELQQRFHSFVNAETPDPTVAFVPERGQKRPASGGASPFLHVVASAPTPAPAEPLAQLEKVASNA